MTATAIYTTRADLHRSFGGSIYPSDFNTESSYGNIIQRISSDARFDEQCKRNEICRQRSKQEKPEEN